MFFANMHTYTHMYVNKYIHACTGWGKTRFTVVCETQFILVLFVKYCIIFQTTVNLLLPHPVYVCVYIYMYMSTCMCIHLFTYLYLCISLYYASMVHNKEPRFPLPIKLRISDALSHMNCGLCKPLMIYDNKIWKALSILCFVIRIYTQWSSASPCQINRSPIFKAVYSFIL